MASNKMDPGQDPQPKAKKSVKSSLISPLVMSGSVASTYGGVAERPWTSHGFGGFDRSPPLADDGQMSLMPHVEHEGPKTEIAEYGSTG